MNASRCSECGAVTTSGEKRFDLPIAAPGSQYHRLLNSNEVPLDSDSTLVRSVISKAVGRLADLDDAISELRGRMKELEEERALVSTHLAKNAAIISPLRRMPPEVLGEIFSWTLPSVGVLHQRHFGVAISPWVLTHVSSHWRAVSLSTPSLWSLIVVDFSHEPPYPLPMVKAHIQRAHLLKIHFYGGNESDSRPQIEIFRCLVEHSVRWQDFCVCLTPDLLPLLTGLRNRLTSLRRLWLEWTDRESQTGVDYIDCFERAPSLVDVAIYNEYRYVPTLLPSHQLTQYDIDGPWEMHRGILQQTPNLVQARIYTDFDDEPWSDTGEIIHLLRLQRLLVSHEEILNFLRVPVLQEIALKAYEEEDLNHLLLDPFMLRSGCTLRHLQLMQSPKSSENIPPSLNSP
ncbi:hypothetical protein C8R44DRAFT_341786 [Mycena epipterygia]|nr:hypothetical protein C8R44DRAFT_341786 [Mycena epipterygia]